MTAPADFPGLVPNPDLVRACTQECAEELARQGLPTLPMCLVEDLIGVLDQPLAPVAPLDHPPAESGYWLALRQLAATPRWRHCQDRLRRGDASSRAGGIRALIMGMLGLGTGSPPAVADRTPQRIEKREKISPEAIRPPPALAMLMSAVRLEMRRDPRRIDLTTAGLYESGGALELPESSLVRELLRELRRKVRGPRAGESARPRGGYHGITSRGRNLENVCLAETGTRKIFAAKLAIGELSYVRRVMGTMESQCVHIPLVLDGHEPDAPCGGCRFISRARALALLLAHDLVWHVTEHARGLRFLFEVSLQGKTGSVRFELNNLPRVAVLANDQPFLAQVGPALPLFLREWDAPRAEQLRVPPVLTWPIAIRVGGRVASYRAPGIGIALERGNLRVARSGSRDWNGFDYSTKDVRKARRTIIEHTTRELIHALGN